VRAAATRPSSVFVSPSQTTATADHSNRLLRWFGWRRFPVARPTIAESAIQSPSGSFGANTWTRPITALATPATASAIAKARNAGRPRPARRADAATAATSAAGTIVPALESASVDGTEYAVAASASTAHTASAASRASVPCERGQTLRGRLAPRTSRNAPQPTNAAAWLKKVADGETFHAIIVGSATAAIAHATIAAPAGRS